MQFAFVLVKFSNNLCARLKQPRLLKKAYTYLETLKSRIVNWIINF